MRIDAHQHFWNLDRVRYPWLVSAYGPIYRTFEPLELEPLLMKAGIDKTVLVQAMDSDEDTEYMLETAARFDWIGGVVGWVPLDRPDDAVRKLGAYAGNSVGADWHGDYHMNYNAQQPFWVAFSSNHADKHLAYANMVDHVLPVSRQWARDYYGMRGAYFPHSAYPVKMTMMPYPVPHWGWEICETPWTVQSLWWHYLYTMDKVFLSDRAFGPMKDAALFMVDYMKRPDASGDGWDDDFFFCILNKMDSAGTMVLEVTQLGIINRRLDELFAEWRRRYPSGVFIEDGLLDEEAWTSRPGLKIVVLLKEPTEDRNHPTTEEWKYQTFIAERGYLKERGTTWPNLIRWTYGILHGFPDYRYVKEKEEYIRRNANDFLGSVCFVNVKKTVGSTQSDDRQVYQTGLDAADLLLEQIKILSPNIVLCCGQTVFNIVRDSLAKENVYFENSSTSGGLEKLWWNELRTNIINYNHPMAYFPSAMTYTYLMTELQKIL
ncbi:amidohydrolase family protein [Cohnella yongneupensis]|uniref:Amidohydrolase family protein n=1 Tax=Cohnella yongneupensis TaxID=425006 RepID=A0ABW0QWG2_9BACL